MLATPITQPTADWHQHSLMFAFDYTPVLWLYFLSAGISLAFAWYASRQTASTLNRAFTWLMLAAGWWALTSMLEIVSANEETLLFWMKLKYLGVIPVAPLWLIMTIAYVQRPQWLKLWFVRAVLGFDLVMIVFVFTNDETHWWWSQWQYESTPWLHGMVVQWGWAFWVHVALAYSMLFTVMLLLLRFYWNVSPFHRQQIKLLLIGLALPLSSNALLLSGRVPSALTRIDITPIPMAAAGVIIGYALFNYRLLFAIPIARDIVFNQVNDGVIVLDHNQLVIDVNQAALRYLGITHTRVVGRCISDLEIAPDLRDCLAPGAENDIRDSSAYEVVSQQKGHPLYLHVTTTAINESDTTSAHRRMVTLHDITEHKKYQETVTRYVRMVAHDVRSPLSLAVGYISLMAESPLDDKTLSYLHIVEKALQRIDRLTAELLDLERLRQGVGLYRKSFAPEEIAQQAFEDILPLATAKTQKFRLQQSNHLPCLYGDPMLIRQALVNLSTNAIKYTPPAGDILLHVQQENDSVVFSVEDNGPGIAPERQANLFEPFQHGRRESGAERGNGLGLSLAKAIVEAHQGQVLVDSTLGQGSIFRIVLPLESGGAQTNPA